MDFSENQPEREFRAHLRSLLTSPPLADEIDKVRATPGEADERPLYRMLGERGLLAASWPAAYGGQDRASVAGVITGEELVLAGVPDTLYVNGIATVGQLILTAGTRRQRSRFLPPLARGEKFATVLYTEPDAGCDLASLATSAVADGADFVLSGIKMYSLKARFADVGLCAARLPEPGPKYTGITLFLVDMASPGVTVRPLPSCQREQFHVVELDEVRVSGQRVLGKPGDGWAMLARALPYERTGIDLAARARRWYQVGCRAAGARGESAESTARLGAIGEAARLLAWRAASAVGSGRADDLTMAVAKWYCGEVAADTARWLGLTAGLDAAENLAAQAAQAVAELPGLTLSGGTSEMMLQVIAGYLPGADQTAG